MTKEKRRNLVQIRAKKLQLPLLAPWTYAGGGEVQLHSLLTSARCWGQLKAADALPSVQNLDTHCIEG